MIVWVNRQKAESRKLTQLPPIHLWEHLKISLTVFSAVDLSFSRNKLHYQGYHRKHLVFWRGATELGFIWVLKPYIRNGPGKRSHEQGSHPRATTTNGKSGTSFCSWLRQGKLSLCQTAHLLQTTPNGRTHKPYSNWERIYSFCSLSFQSLCQTGTIVITSSSAACLFFFHEKLRQLLCLQE